MPPKPTNLTEFGKRRRLRELARFWGTRASNGQFKPTKRGKYNASGRWVGEQWFASKAEADRYEQLVEMQAAGTIAELRCQVPFPCRVNGQLITTYLADFQYRTHPGKLGSRVLVEDVKGLRLEAYKIKRKLVHALHPIEIIEIKVPKRGGVSACRFLTADQIGKPATKEDAWMTGSSPGLRRSKGG